MASRPMTVDALPVQVWANICSYLPCGDLAGVYGLGGNAMAGCASFFQTHTLTLKLYCADDDDEDCALSEADRRGLDTVGRMVRSARFCFERYIIELSSYNALERNMKNTLYSVSLCLEPMEGVNFVACKNDTDFNWRHFVQMCPYITQGCLKLHFDLFICRSQPLKTTFKRLFACPESDFRYLYLTALEMQYFPPEKKILAVRPDLRPSASAAFLRKLPSLQRLHMARHNLSEFVLDQLARTNRKLECLIIEEYVDHPYRPQPDISTEAWQRLIESYTYSKQRFTVSGSIIQEKSKGKFWTFFRSTFKPEVPLSTLTADVVYESSIRKVLWLCSEFYDTLELVTINVRRPRILRDDDRRAMLKALPFDLKFTRLLESKRLDNMYIITLSKNSNARSQDP